MTRDGRVAYRVKYPRGNRTHLLMEPVQSFARLASLIPPPRHPLVRYWLRFIATITEQQAVTKILDAVGLPSRPPLPHARAPDPQLELDPVMSVA